VGTQKKPRRAAGLIYLGEALLDAARVVIFKIAKDLEL
jgi:hypothetical protein